MWRVVAIDAENPQPSVRCVVKSSASHSAEPYDNQVKPIEQAGVTHWRYSLALLTLHNTFTSASKAPEVVISRSYGPARQRSVSARLRR